MQLARTVAVALARIERGERAMVSGGLLLLSTLARMMYLNVTTVSIVAG